jgi:hypothetical protein
MARRRSGRGSGGFFGKVVWAFFILCLVFAWFKTPIPAGSSVSTAWEFAQAKSHAVDAWVKDFTKGGFSLPNFVFHDGKSVPVAPGGTTTEPPTPEQKSTALSQLNSVTVADAQTVDYQRSEWKHWINQSGSSCWDVREAVLYRDAEKGSTVLLDKNGSITSNVGSACSIKSGKWVDPYSSKTFTNPSDLDVDHVVPLSYTAQHGGQAWSSDMKRDYANDLTGNHHLLAVSASENRSKGDNGPSEYKPKVNLCEYGMNWTKVTSTWKISVTQADKDSIASMLSTCA